MDIVCTFIKCVMVYQEEVPGKGLLISLLICYDTKMINSLSAHDQTPTYLF
jgi:hypothetical protein